MTRASNFVHSGPLPVFRADRAPMAGFGQKQSFTGTMPNVRLQIGKRTIEPITGAHYDLFVGNVSLPDGYDPAHASHGDCLRRVTLSWAFGLLSPTRGVLALL